VKLREQVMESVREMVLDHRELEVREIVEVPAIRERLETLWPIPVAATQFYRHQVRKFIASEIVSDGTRTFVSVVQPELLADTSDEDAPAPMSRVYVNQNELLSDNALMTSYLTTTHRLINGIVRRSQLPGALKARLMTAIEDVFTNQRAA